MFDACPYRAYGDGVIIAFVGLHTLVGFRDASAIFGVTVGVFAAGNPFAIPVTVAPTVVRTGNTLALVRLTPGHVLARDSLTILLAQISRDKFIRKLIAGCRRTAVSRTGVRRARACVDIRSTTIDVILACRLWQHLLPRHS